MRYALPFLCLVASVAAADEPVAPDYNTQVLPIFQKYCTGCHNASEKEGGLVLESYEQVLAGGRKGSVVVAGKSDQSRLLLVLDGRIKPAMPPEGNEPPTADEAAILKAWVDAGAKGPSGAPPDPTRLITPAIPIQGTPRASINAAAWSPDRKLIALARYGKVELLSAETRQVTRELPGHRGNVAGVAFSVDGTKLVAACGEPGLFGEARLWNVADGALIAMFVGHRDSLFAAALSPDGSLLATGGYDEQIKLWDVASGGEVRSLAGHNGAIYELAFRPDGKILASASGDRTVKLWDVATGTRLDTLNQPIKEQYTAAFSPDGSRVAAGGVDNRLRVWQVSPDGKEGTNPIQVARFAHQGAIVKLAFSPDGRSLVSASEDGTVKLWDALEVRERQLLEPQPDWPVALAFSPDSKSVFVGRLDGTYAIYDAFSGQAVAALGRVHRPARVALGLAAAAALAFLENQPAPAKPELTSLSQRGVQRGVATKLKLTGKDLDGLTEVKFNDAKVTATIVPADQAPPGESWIEVMPAADTARGSYELQVVGPGGASGNVKLHVDSISQVAETEPNNAPASATTATLPAGCWGVIDAPGDVDYFQFDATAGQTLVFELSAASLGSKANAVLTLTDAKGRVLAASNDFDGDVDPLLAYAIPADGHYTVAVSDLTLGASAEHFYRLSIGGFPYVTGCYPLSIAANQQSQVELTGFNLPAGSAVTMTAGAGGELDLPVDPEKFRSRKGLKVLAGVLPEALEVEPNGQPAEATSIPTPGVANGRLWKTANGAAQLGAADNDLFRFEARAGQPWIIETDAARRGSPVDTRIEVLDISGKPVERLWLQAVRDSYITFRPIDSNAGDVRVANWEEMGLNQFMYLQGEVCKLFRMPQGPDSGFAFYSWAGKRMCYFDTSPTAHAVDDACYIVEPQPVGAALVPTGLPVFPVYFANDDDGERKLGSDSKLLFTAPADGPYLVRVSDVRGLGGDRFAYRLIIREPRPDFTVSLGGANPAVNAGSGKDIVLSAERFDGFDGDIAVEVGGLPPGFSVSGPIVIQAGHFQAKAVINAAADAPAPTETNASQTVVKATAVINGMQVVKDVNNLGKISLAEKPKVLARLEPIDAAAGGGVPGGVAEISIAPGTSVAAMLRVERNGFDDRISFDVQNLPHGIIVDDIGLNGVLIPEKMTERRIFLTAAPWVPETDRPFHAVAQVEGNQASGPVLLRVRKK